MCLICNSDHLPVAKLHYQVEYLCTYCVMYSAKTSNILFRLVEILILKQGSHTLEWPQSSVSSISPTLIPHIQWWMSYDCFDVQDIPPSLSVALFVGILAPKLSQKQPQNLLLLNVHCKLSSLQVINSFRLLLVVVFVVCNKSTE